MVFLSETKMQNHRIAGLRRRMGFNFGFDVPPIRVAGGLSLWWNDPVEVSVLRSTNNIIHMLVRMVGVYDWFQATWLYGNPYRVEKAAFWAGVLDDLRPTVKPWFCGGDLNEYLWDFENEREGRFTHKASISARIHVKNGPY